MQASAVAKLKEYNQSQIDALRHNIQHLSGELHLTDIYLDRYLPCKVLNMIRDMTEDSLSDYSGRKEFCERAKAKFEDFQKKIKLEEKYDKMKSKPVEFRCMLSKRYYTIPTI